MADFEDIVVAHATDHVLQITLNRPKARNALRTNLLREIAETLDAAANDDAVRAVVLTGGEKVFAAGADIGELASLDLKGVVEDARPGYWQRIADFPKPIVAAVNGYALGGGCELAMHADIIIAADDAQFGQPEINLGILPGAGGTQRLIRTVGKPLAMKMVLAGEWIDARTALTSGLIAEITPREATIERAQALAATIAAKPPMAVRQAKDVLLKAFDTGLGAGLRLERQAFTILAATEDRQEGLSAFMEKRKPEFKGR
ncbi:2,3-dehydroadipyl-CoA hydratase [Arhodomonas aquaeolei]|uniref:2,3-dehydroadipyl-CoA hydratase PaaF n=1 Tax=Arhodomonas aquaeolei TaxID=2369 RepID=UPI002167B3FA|nr:2,3-dehydroadipyl-CoA hydratase PaaF [Arhodomonas aquaeolei]MCS4502701.1 2,3-dehydroadipyl-CoA hydratase [Arhodomonas aquaeolei]